MDLLSLPTAVFCDIVSDRLNLKGLVRLDSAFCCQDREVWSQRLQSKQFKMKDLVLLAEEKQLQWLLIRNIKSTNAKIGRWGNLDEVPKDFHTRMLSKYWGLHGHCVRAMQFVITDFESELNLAVIHCRNLTKLRMVYASLTCSFADLLRYNPNIQELECTQVQSKEDNLFEGLTLHKLQIMKVTGYIASKGNLWHESAFSDSLHTVILDNCRIREADLSALATNCPELKSFECSSSGSSGLLANLARKMTRLVHLSIACGYLVTDATVLAIATHLTSLRTLNIQHCNKLTDVSLLHVADHLGGTLEMLYADVKNVESKEDEQILQTFSRKCTKLSYLNIYCRHKGTSVLVRGFPALRTLVVETWEAICKSSRDFVATMRPDLKLLVHDKTTEYNILSMPI